MLTFGESVMVALISAAVALITSLAFRAIDRPRPKWRVVITSSDLIPQGDKFTLKIKATNVGTGSAHNARIISEVRSSEDEYWSPVLQPGGSIHGRILVEQRLKPEYDAKGRPVLIPVGPEGVEGAVVNLRWSTPLVPWEWSRTWRADRLLRRQQSLKYAP